MRFDVLALATLFFLCLIWLYRRDQARGKAVRLNALEPCRGLFSDTTWTVDRAGFPVMRGRYRGHEVCLELLVEAVSVRKLPQLLLKVTLAAPVATRGVLDIMQRPLNVEFYSPANDLPHALPRPPGWPEHAVLRSDQEELPFAREILDRHVALFDDSQIKELLVAPRGLRIVYRLAEAERSTYLVLRQAQFRTNQAEPGKVAELLDDMLTLRAEIAAATPQRLSA